MVNNVRHRIAEKDDAISHRPKSVYLFVGEEDHLKEKALRALKGSLLGEGTAELNYNVFYGNDSSAKEILDCAMTLPFLGERRLVVVKRADKLKQDDKKLLAAYTAKPQTTTCLVLSTEDELFLGDTSSLSGDIGIMRFDRIPPFKLSSWIKETASVHGKTIDEDAIELLTEIFANSDQGILEKEIEKLVSFVGTRSQISAADVEALTGKGLVNSTFDLADAIGRRDAKNALRIFGNLFATAIPRYKDVVGLIAWHLKTLLRGRLLLEKGWNEFAIIRYLKIPTRLKKDFLSQLKISRTEELASKLEILLYADLDMKIGRMDQRSCLEITIVRLCLC